MICSRCGVDKEDSPANFPTINGKRKGLVCRQCRNKRDHQKPGAGICVHCNEPITDRPKQARYHIDEAHPDCYAAYMLHTNAKQHSYERRKPTAMRKAEAAKKPRRICVRCGVKPTYKQNHFFCEHCFRLASVIADDFQEAWELNP